MRRAEDGRYAFVFVRLRPSRGGRPSGSATLLARSSARRSATASSRRLRQPRSQVDWEIAEPAVVAAVRWRRERHPRIHQRQPGVLQPTRRRQAGPLAIALALHTRNLLLRTRAWYAILRAAYPGRRATATARARAPTSPGVGVNAIAPARGGDLVKIFLTRTRLRGLDDADDASRRCSSRRSSTSCSASCSSCYALTQHVLPRVPELPSTAGVRVVVGGPRTRRVTAIIATFILLACILAARRAEDRRRGVRRARAPGLHDPAHAAPLRRSPVAFPQVARLGLPRRRRGGLPRGVRHPRHAAQRAARDGRRLAHDAAAGHARRRGHAAGADRRRAQRRGQRRASCSRSRSACRRP